MLKRIKPQHPAITIILNFEFYNARFNYLKFDLSKGYLSYLMVYSTTLVSLIFRSHLLFIWIYYSIYSKFIYNTHHSLSLFFSTHQVRVSHPILVKSVKIP